MFTLSIFFYNQEHHNWASLVAQRLKRLPAMWETWVRSLGQEDPLDKEMATHSSILAWRIPWTEESGGLQSIGSQRVGHERSNWTCIHTYQCLYKWSCCCLVTKSCPALATSWTVAARLLGPWDSPGKNTGVGGHSLLQGIFLTQGLNPGLLHQQVDSLSLSHQGSPMNETTYY